MAGGSVWQQMRRLRHRDMLQGCLLRAFENDQQECRVIQSDAFRPLMTRWAELLLAQGKSGQTADVHAVPEEVQEQAKRSKEVEVSWLIRRLTSRDNQHRGPPHFPSVLLQRGPQYPFQPYELTYLRTRTGSLRGTELTEKIELPPPPEDSAATEPSKPRDLWAEGCLDDDDLIDYRKAPFEAR
mmetsp:Transcript_7877/g.12845  ORF Transcript_7877/g.12845 Transcript_7877/m.12845 type:complete len:184 (-) Transcript_7877:16-567(-)